METIVVSFDESEPAGRALARAADLAESLDATLVVVAVAEPPAPGSGIDAVLPGAPERLAGEATEEFNLADQRLERARRSLEGRAIRTEFVSDTGEPADRILELADQWAAAARPVLWGCSNTVACETTRRPHPAQENITKRARNRWEPRVRRLRPPLTPTAPVRPYIVHGVARPITPL